MRKIFYMLAVFLSASVVLSSCLKNDETETTLYDDMAITSFTLGTLNRYTTITSSSTGNDSTIKTTVTGAAYPMSIDHVGCKIYNRTPLPMGTDIKHVVCTLATRNNGVVYVQNIENDTTILTYHTSADSVDFSQTRRFRVYSTDGSGSRDYFVTLNVDNEVGTELEWTLKGTATVEADFSAQQLFAKGDSVVMAARAAEPDWANEAKDDADSLLPAVGTTVTASCDYTPVDNATLTVAVGQPRQADEPYMRLWRKVSLDNGEGQWVFMPWDDTNRYRLPRAAWYSLAWHNGVLLALSSDLALYQSRDQGITWKTTTTYALPSKLSGTQALIGTDDAGSLWMVSNSGQVWKCELK